MAPKKFPRRRLNGPVKTRADFNAETLLGMLKSDAKTPPADIAQYISDNDIAVNKADDEGNTLLMLLANKNLHYAAGLLIAKGADVNARNKSNGTALMRAAACGHDRVIELLLEHGAKPDLASNDGTTALHYACICGQSTTAEILIRAGASMHISDNLKGATPFLYAIEFGREKLAIFMLDHGANPDDAFSKTGVTATSSAVMKTNGALIAKLIEKNADINKPDLQGYSPALHAASISPKIFRQLHESSADICATLPDGKNAADISMFLEVRNLVKEETERREEVRKRTLRILDQGVPIKDKVTQEEPIKKTKKRRPFGL